MHVRARCAGLLVAVALLGWPARPTLLQAPPHNVVLFIPDGLRSSIVNTHTAPALAALRDRGIDFRNPHALFPTLTTLNAAAMATGHFPGDTGNFSNVIYAGRPIRSVTTSVTPFLEHDVALGDLDRAFDGDYLNEVTVLKAAREAGFWTAAIGKVGPAAIFDHTDRSGEATIIVDDATGSIDGIPLSEDMQSRLHAAGLPLTAPPRAENGQMGTSTLPGTRRVNDVQQNYFVDVTTNVVLPWFKASGKPFVLVFWSRDPDGSQHNQGDSLNRLTPGINGPTSMAAIANADNDLRRIEAALTSLGLADTTNVVVAADHGFSTVSKQSETSVAARASYADVPASFLPPGFLAIDLAAALKLPLFDPDKDGAPIKTGSFPSRSNGVIGADPQRPDVVVASNGGSDLIYLPRGDRPLVERIVTMLGTQDYVSGIFVDDAFGEWPGALPLSAINLVGTARTPRPSIVVTFRSFSTGCDQPLRCAVEVSDTTLHQGQGNHGSFSRADTMNFMAAAGPDFKTAYVDELPVSNADVGRTLGNLLGLTIGGHGALAGRVLTEALRGGAAPQSASQTLGAHSKVGSVQTRLDFSIVGGVRYFDAAGTAGRTVGLR